MRVGILGINFKTADLALHELVARSALAVFQENITIPMVLLSTCNRTEIYFSSENLAHVKNQLQERVGFPLSDHLYSFFEVDCFAHLCRVTAGLDSAILLETEIARQVKTAYAHACSRYCLPSGLHYLFQKAFKVAKSVRNYFLLQNGGSILFETLWQIAEMEFTDLRQVRILLVGYSETHRRLFDFLENKGLQQITFCTRRPENVLGINVLGRERLSDWNEYDLISCAAQADAFLISGKGKKKHLIFDLSVPRNVDPNVEFVKLYNIEQLNRLVAKKKDLLKEPLELSETFLKDNVSRLSHLYHAKTAQSCFKNSGFVAL